jgi:hypothetical protein
MDIATNKAGLLVLSSDAQKALPYFCLDCGDLIYLKLGDYRQAHFSHFPGSKCLGISPHDEVKYKLAKLFMDSSISRLEGYIECTSSICDNFRKVAILFPAYDSVKVEYRYGSVIFDVALLKDSLPVAALEVYFTHVSLPERERQNIPYLEIDASVYIKFGRFDFLSKHLLSGFMASCSYCDVINARVKKREEALDLHRKNMQIAIELQHQAALARLELLSSSFPSTNRDRGEYAQGEFIPRYKDGSIIPRDVWNRMKASKPGGV